MLTKNIFGLASEIKRFFVSAEKRFELNNLLSLFDTINSKSGGNYFIINLKKKNLLEYEIIFKDMFEFLKTYENSIDGYFIGLTFEYFMFTHQKSKTGTFYTPKNMVDAICERTINWFIFSCINDKYSLIDDYKLLTLEIIQKSLNKDLIESFKSMIFSMTIFDPTMGTGNFLLGAFEYILYLKRFFKFDTVNPISICNNQLFGLDSNLLSIKIAKIRLILQIIDENFSQNDDSINNISFNIISTNSLTSLPPISSNLPFKTKTEKNSFSLILSNPPYGAKLDPNFKKKAKKIFKTISGYEVDYTDHEYKLTKGNPNSAVIFTEICGNLLSDIGFCAIILPKSLLYIESWQSLRYYLLNEVSIQSIIDLQKGFDSVLLEQIIIIFNKRNNTKRDIFIEEFDKSNKILIKNTVKFKFLHFNNYPITINNENENMYLQILHSSVTAQNIFATHRGLIISKFLQRDTSSEFVRVFRGKDIQPLFIRSSSFSPQNKIENKPYFRFGTLMIQRIVAHVKKPYPHIILTVTLNPGSPTVDTIVNIYPKKPYPNICKILALYLNSELINWFVYHFVYCEAIRSMDIFGYYFNQIPLKSFYDYKDYLIPIFENITLLKTIKNRNETYIDSIELYICFFERLANALIYYIYFKDIKIPILENQEYFDQSLKFKALSNEKFIFNFDNWYQNEQFSDLENSIIDKKLLSQYIHQLFVNPQLMEFIEIVENHSWVKLILKEFR